MCLQKYHTRSLKHFVLFHLLLRPSISSLIRNRLIGLNLSEAETITILIEIAITLQCQHDLHMNVKLNSIIAILQTCQNYIFKHCAMSFCVKFNIRVKNFKIDIF